MSIEEAQAELTKLRGYADTGSLASHYEEVDALFWAVCRKRVKKCNCKDRYNDALIEIYRKLNYELSIKSKEMAVNDTKARLVKGVVLQFNGNHYTNANLTDDVARAFLVKFPMRKDWFEALPSPTTAKEVVAEVADTPEKGAEITPKEDKSESKPNPPTKKKTAKKRK